MIVYVGFSRHAGVYVDWRQHVAPMVLMLLKTLLTILVEILDGDGDDAQRLENLNKDLV